MGMYVYIYIYMTRGGPEYYKLILIGGCDIKVKSEKKGKIKIREGECLIAVVVMSW